MVLKALPVAPAREELFVHRHSRSRGSSVVGWRALFRSGSRTGRTSFRAYGSGRLFQRRNCAHFGSDLFGNNAYSHDPRTQFLNWSLMEYGAYDYAADAGGYFWGTALEYYYDDWAIRAGRFLEPKQPNQQQLDYSIFAHFGDQVELEHAHKIGELPGKIRLLAFHDRARMARYDDALALAAQTGGPPDMGPVRNADRDKTGFGVSLEQQVSADVGVFARVSRGDGQTETESYYAIRLMKQAWLTLDWQRIGNPGYNADRGPVGIGSVRLHVEL